MNQNYLNGSYKIGIKKLFYYRAFCLIYLNLTFFHIHFYNLEFMKTFVWLTNWGVCCNYLYFWLACIENVTYFLNENKQFYHNKLWMAAQFIFMIAITLEIPICIMYWGFIFFVGGFEKIDFLLLEVNIHAIIILLIIIEFYLNDIIIPRKHGLIFIFLSLAYLIVNLTYVLVTELEIYPGVNWRNGLSYIIAVATIILIFISFACAVIYCEKVKLASIHHICNLYLQKSYLQHIKQILDIFQSQIVINLYVEGLGQRANLSQSSSQIIMNIKQYSNYQVQGRIDSKNHQDFKLLIIYSEGIIKMIYKIKKFIDNKQYQIIKDQKHLNYKNNIDNGLGYYKEFYYSSIFCQGCLN
ncbi:hypothetical protein pb186bvf_010086 [Paramecium bursaria]